MNRYEFLRGLHATCRPRTYLEIGVNDGRSLTLSKAKTIAVDPAFKVTSEITCDIKLLKTTSDAFFARKNPVKHFPRGIIDLTFIDGMHLFEYAFRDFFNAERHTAWHSVLVLDDMLPRNVDEAARDRHTDAWTGDVYKVATVLQKHRPDLLCVHVNTTPTGQLVIFGPDATSSVLPDRYDRICEEFIREDPQDVPEAILTRSDAVDPEKFLAAPFWTDLLRARSRVFGRRMSWEQLRPQIEAAAQAARRPVPAAS